MEILKPGSKIDRVSSRSSIFLAGPTPRHKSVIGWRDEAIEILQRRYNGLTIFIPEPFLDIHEEQENNYYHQIDWEDRALEASTVILFWVPRNLKNMPAFTTNVEFGAWVKSGKVVYGRPDDAPKCGYLDWHARKNLVPISNTLEDTMVSAFKMISLINNTPEW